MVRFCPNCGTEVDEHAAFCPTCGQPLDTEERVTPPPASWGPDDPTRPEPRVEEADDRPSTAGEEPAPSGTVGPAAAAPPAPPSSAPQRAGSPDPGGAAPAQGRGGATLPRIDLPITWPVNLSGWLIGIGAVVGVLAMFLPWSAATLDTFGGFGSFVNVLFLVVLLAVAAAVFFSGSVPQVPHQRLGILAVALVGLGIGLDRLGLAFTGVGAVVFLLGMIAMAVGAVLLELGRDRPLAGPGGAGR